MSLSSLVRKGDESGCSVTFSGQVCSLNDKSHCSHIRLVLFFSPRELKKATGDWFYDQKVNRFAYRTGSELIRMSLRRKPAGVCFRGDALKVVSFFTLVTTTRHAFVLKQIKERQWDSPSFSRHRWVISGQEERSIRNNRRNPGKSQGISILNSSITFTSFSKIIGIIRGKLESTDKIKAEKNQ